MTRVVLFCAIAVLLISAAHPVDALTPDEVIVVYNSSELPDPSSPDYAIGCQIIPASEKIAEYYASHREIPANNVVGLPLLSFYELVTGTDYLVTIASPLWNNCLSQPEYAHIKCIVLCYGIPSRITYQSSYDMSVDSALSLLGNPGTPTAQTWGRTLENPYCGKKTGFSAFRDSEENAIDVDGQTWKLNYLVARLDGFSTPTVNVDGVGIPQSVRDTIDRGADATAGGSFVVDRSSGEVASVTQQFTSDGLPTDDIISDSTSVFLTGQQDVIGYWGEHMLGGNANNYTTWTRPFHHWLPGGIAIYNTNDGHSFRVPKYIWWELNGPPGYEGEPDEGKLKVTGFFTSAPEFSDQYAGHQVVLCDKNGSVLKRSTFDRGTSTMDLSDVVWPGDGLTYLELRFPTDDPMFPDAYIPSSRTPSTANGTVFASRNTGIVYHCYDPENRLARCVSSSYVSEAQGASGTISILNHTGSFPFGNAGIAFSRYAAGYAWAESAYMAIPSLGTHLTVLGDPLMAPFAPLITITVPAQDMELYRASFTVEADAVAGAASAVHGVTFSLRGPDGQTELLGTDATVPYAIAIDPALYPGGIYAILAASLDETGNPHPNVAERKVQLGGGYALQSSIAAARLLADGNGVELDVVISATDSPSLEDAFYAKDSAGLGGVRVAGNRAAFSGLQPGSRIALLGRLGSSPEGEREILLDCIEPIAALPPPAPLAMTVKSLGGCSPNTYTNGIEGALGLYNVGQLVRVYGCVSYVGADFVYVDDGSGAVDSGGLLYYPVPLNGGAIPTDGVTVKGVCAYLPGIALPGLGDRVIVDGISSCKVMNGHRCRYLRAQGITTADGYQPCYVWTGSQYRWFFANDDNTHQFEIGERVRIETGDVLWNMGSYFTAWCPVHNRPGDLVGVDFGATTALTTDYTGLIVVGSITGINPLTDFSIKPDALYLSGPGGQLNLSRVGYVPGWLSAESVPCDASYMLSRAAFTSLDTRPGCIGWALAQPDGTVVTLHGESITSVTDGGRCLALRESFEPETETPRLVLQLTGTAPGLTMWNQVDITGTLATLSSGQRAIVYPSAVYRWESESGLPTILMPKSYDEEGNPEVWPWRTLVYPE